jgi:CRP/FNR family transcriptional regulator, anaerobic regulatory protein
MMTRDIFQEIANIFPVIHQLPDPLQLAIQREGFPIQPFPGQTAFDYGDSCSTYLFLICGSIRVVKSIGNGREILLYDVRPGDSCILTVSSILGCQPYLAQGIWEARSAAYGIPAALFRRLISESDEFRTFIFRSFSERISHLMELVDAVIWKPVSSRLAKLLLEKDRNCNTIHISHQTLANELGTVREVISRSLEEFERQGWVRLERMHIHIINREGLGDLVQFRVD